MTTKPPKYSLVEAINVALTLAAKALEEIRKLAREPGPAGKDGLDGRDGKDGIGFDEIQEEYQDDGRVLIRRFLNGGQLVKEFRHQTKNPVWRGPFDRGKEYQPGDMATWNGSIWHCNADSKGEIGSERWSLAVKKGRDGKE